MCVNLTADWLGVTKMDTHNIYSDEMYCVCVVVTMSTGATWWHHILRGLDDTIIVAMFGMVLISQPLINWPVIVKNDYTQIRDPSLHILSDVFFRITQYISLGQLMDGLLVREINMERQRWLITGVLKRFIWEATSRRWSLPIDMHPSIVGDEE